MHRVYAVVEGTPTQPPHPLTCVTYPLTNALTISPRKPTQLGELHRVELWLKQKKLDDLTEMDLYELKRRGFSDSQIARAVGECSGGDMGGNYILVAGRVGWEAQAPRRFRLTDRAHRGRLLSSTVGASCSEAGWSRGVLCSRGAPCLRHAPRALSRGWSLQPTQHHSTALTCNVRMPHPPPRPQAAT